MVFYHSILHQPLLSTVVTCLVIISYPVNTAYTQKAVLQLAKKGNIIAKPEDIVKQPTVLEFLGKQQKD